jgi:hypothetical protein
MNDLKPIPVWTVRVDGHETDGFCTHAGPLPDPGDIIDVRQNITGKLFSARVTEVHTDGPDPHVAAVEVDS